MKGTLIKKILITGGSGMVGRNFLEHQSASEYEIFFPSSTELNLIDYEEVQKYLKKANPDIVIHAAGKVGGIQDNIQNPIEFLDINNCIGRNIIMASYNQGIKNFINLASTCMYPKNAKNPLKEELILTGTLEPTNEGYALAKIMATRLCQYIQNNNNSFNYKTIIPCNLFGRFDKFDPKSAHLVPAIINKIHHAKEQNMKAIEIWGDGNSRREFMYTEDLVDAIYKALKNIDSLPQLMNCGLGKDFSITDYYEIVAKVIGWQGSFNYDLAKPAGMKQKLCDISLQNKWGWRPKTSLMNGVSKTYKYYLDEFKK